MQRAFQKRTQYACIHRGSEKLSLISTMRNEAQLIVIQKLPKDKAGRFVSGRGLSGSSFRPEDAFVVLNRRSNSSMRLGAKSILEKNSSTRSLRFVSIPLRIPMFSDVGFPGGIPVVTIIMTVQKILHIQFIQFTLTDNFLPISKRGFFQQGKSSSRSFPTLLCGLFANLLF